MWNSIYVHLVIGFALRQVAQFGASTDWKKVEGEFDGWLKAEVPYLCIESAFERVGNPLIESIAIACSHAADFQGLLEAVARKDFRGAGALLLGMAQKVATTPKVAELLAAA